MTPARKRLLSSIATTPFEEKGPLVEIKTEGGRPVEYRAPGGETFSPRLVANARKAGMIDGLKITARGLVHLQDEIRA